MPTIHRHVVSIDDFQFNVGLADDGANYGVDVLDGWDDTPEPLVNVIALGYGDGVMASGMWPLRERYITVAGWVDAPDALTAQEAKHKLAELFDPRHFRRITRFSPVPQAMDGRPSTGLSVPAESDLETAFRWSATLLVPWPFKISPDPLTGEAATYNGGNVYRLYPRTYPMTYLNEEVVAELPDFIDLYNAGTAVAWPVLTVTGPLDGGTWSVQNEANASTLGFDVDVLAGQQLQIDTRTHSARMNGVPVEYAMTGSWWGLEPKSINRIRLITPDANEDARLAVTAYSTWR